MQHPSAPGRLEGLLREPLRNPEIRGAGSVDQDSLRPRQLALVRSIQRLRAAGVGGAWVVGPRQSGTLR